MDSDRLESWFVGTATMVLTALVLLIGLYIGGEFSSILITAGTVPVSMLFGYLWLLTLIAASTLELKLSIGAIGAAATIGGLFALVYLTVVFIIGFVAPVPDPLEPSSRSLIRAVATGTVGGILTGGTYTVFFTLLRRIGVAVAYPSG